MQPTMPNATIALVIKKKPKTGDIVWATVKSPEDPKLKNLVIHRLISQNQTKGDNNKIPDQGETQIQGVVIAWIQLEKGLTLLTTYLTIHTTIITYNTLKTIKKHVKIKNNQHTKTIKR